MNLSDLSDLYVTFAMDTNHCMTNLRFLSEVVAYTLQIKICTSYLNFGNLFLSSTSL